MNYWLFAMNKRCKKVIFQYYIFGNLSYLINVQSKKVHTGLQNLPKINKRTCMAIRDTRVRGKILNITQIENLFWHLSDKNECSFC